MDSKHEENLREEFLKFVDEVRETFLRTNDSDDKWGQFQAALKQFHDNITTNEVLVPTLTNLFQGHKNLLSGYRKVILAGSRQTQTPVKNAKREKGRDFLERLKSEDENIYRKVTSALMASHKGELGKPQLYIKICALLIHHPDLFLLYESTLSDGSEESRREIVSLRLRAKKVCLRDVFSILKDYRATIKAIEGSPESLTPLHLRCAAEMYSDSDQEMRKKRMKDLAVRWKKNPKKVRLGVLPRLEMKVMQIQDFYEKFFKYFTQILSHPI